MYQPNPPYSGYQPIHQPMRPPTHPPAPPALSIPGHPPHTYTQYTMSPAPASAIQMRPQQLLPQSPSEGSERIGPEEDFFNLPGPRPTSHIWGGYIWALEVVQHPQRARMCGFGDKDRRPISPPPCIRLVILHADTQQEVDYNDIDLTHLVLTVDIWDLSANREVNLVKQSNASPCISSAATGAYPTTNAGGPPAHDQPRSYDISQIPSFAQHTYATTSPATPSNSNSYYPPNSQSYQQRPTYVNGQSGHSSSYQNGAPAYPRSSYTYSDARYTAQPGPPPPAPPPPQAQSAYGGQLPSINSMTNPVPQPVPQQLPQPLPQPVPQQMQQQGAPQVSQQSGEQSYMVQPPSTTSLYTRNLIGSLCASAFRLKDENDKSGIWFVLQDLSVRTEGWFRLKMNFFNITSAVEKQMADPAGGPSARNPTDPTETAPCLASTFSNPFRVYSAKKFPGVVESTPLSKAFANQGIKIPIRKDTGGKRGRDDSEDDGSGGDD